MFLVCVLWPCVDLLGLFGMGHGALICCILGGEVGQSMRKSRVHGSARWYESVAAYRGALPPGARMGSSYDPLEVAREYEYCRGVRG